MEFNEESDQANENQNKRVSLEREKKSTNFKAGVVFPVRHADRTFASYTKKRIQPCFFIIVIPIRFLLLFYFLMPLLGCRRPFS